MFEKRLGRKMKANEPGKAEIPKVRIPGSGRSMLDYVLTSSTLRNKRTVDDLDSRQRGPELPRPRYPNAEGWQSAS